MPLGSRLKEYIDFKRITAKDFERINGFTNGLISRIIREDGNMNSKHLVVIARNHTDLNMNWLLNGEGLMIFDDDSNNDDLNRKMQEEIEFHKATIKSLRKALDSLTDNV